MAKETTGYIGKDKNGKWFARVTLTGSTGKRRNIARRAASKPEARQILKAIPRQIEGEGEKFIDTARLTFNDLADFYAMKYLKAAEYRPERKVSGLRALDRDRNRLTVRKLMTTSTQETIAMPEISVSKNQLLQRFFLLQRLLWFECQGLYA